MDLAALKHTLSLVYEDLIEVDLAYLVTVIDGIERRITALAKGSVEPRRLAAILAGLEAARGLVQSLRRRKLPRVVDPPGR